MPTFSDRATPDWTAVGVVFDGGSIDVDGLDPWGADWVSAEQHVVVPHPSHASQLHHATVWHARAPDGSLKTFAAVELSNGVWGFYVPGRAI